MNLGQAQVELGERGFQYLTASRQTIMLNAAKNAFEDSWPFPWLEGLVSGTAPLVIPDLKYVVVAKAGTQELWGADVRQLALGNSDINLPGQPAYWYLSDQVGDAVTVRVWPVALASLTVVYVKRSPELSAAADTPLIPARYHPIWLDLAVVEAYHDSDNFSAAQALRTEVNARLGEIIESYETRNRQHAAFNTVRSFSEDD